MIFLPYKLEEENTAFRRSFSEGPIGFKQFTSSTGSGTTPRAFRFSAFLKYNCEKVPVFDCKLSTAAPVSESEMFYDVVTNFLQDLGRVTLNQDYKSFFVQEYLPSSNPDSSSEHVGDSTGSSGGTKRVTWGPIGIGDRRLWWGQPDACVRPLDSANPLDSTLVVATSPDPDESDSETDGESSQVEAKRKVTSAYLPQAVATAIVHSFTQNKRHPQLNPLVPTVLINGSVFRIVLYDCCKDMLLVSSTVTYREGTKLTQLGTLVLWLIINHRYLYLYCVCVCVCRDPKV